MTQKCNKDPKGSGCDKLPAIAEEKTKLACMKDEPCVKAILEKIKEQEIDLSSCPPDADNTMVARLGELTDKGKMPDRDRFLTAVDQSKFDFAELTNEIYQTCKRENPEVPKLIECQSKAIEETYENFCAIPLNR